MTTVAPGPYTHTGPYVDAELFDTTGTPPGFCPECEHAPCVGGGRNLCTMRPRFIVVRAMREETFGLLDQLHDNPLCTVLRMAIYSMSDQARANHGGGLADFTSAEALMDLARTRSQLRELVP